MKYAEIVYTVAEAFYTNKHGEISGWSAKDWNDSTSVWAIKLLLEAAAALQAAGIDTTPPKPETTEEKIARIEQLAIEWDRRMDAYEARLAKLEPVDEGFCAAPGYMPVEIGYNTVVEVMFRDGDTDINKAGIYGWKLAGADDDIVAYRLFK